MPVVLRYRLSEFLRAVRRLGKAAGRLHFKMFVEPPQTGIVAGQQECHRLMLARRQAVAEIEGKSPLSFSGFRLQTSGKWAAVSAVCVAAEGEPEGWETFDLTSKAVYRIARACRYPSELLGGVKDEFLSVFHNRRLLRNHYGNLPKEQLGV